ncbi:MAG: RNase adapter RapZ [Gammaproteobacteria bacterium]|nr:RNase adapter RapZ [Gammaproteobacteria bacterium]MDH3464582.1 RNase adapter RapZ [Gammaproteobacteria bacterium]
MNITIISGLSGSGKSIALQVLEDLGYYCIDNLPAVLLPQFADELKGRSHQSMTHAAVSIDSRNRSFLASLPQTLENLGKHGLDFQIIFLEADEPILLKRFSETRRKHPLTDDSTPLVDGIRLEKKLLAPLSESAAIRIDTTYTTPRELRSLVRDFTSGADAVGPSLLFESFGYKHGTPLDADFVFDVRCLPNPYWETELRPLTGLDEPVKEYLANNGLVKKMIDHIAQFIDEWLPQFEVENRSYITVAIGCTGGQHRSVYITQCLNDYFSARRVNVQMRHRELPESKSLPAAPLTLRRSS